MLLSFKMSWPTVNWQSVLIEGGSQWRVAIVNRYWPRNRPSYRPSNWKDYKIKKNNNNRPLWSSKRQIISRIVTWYFANLPRWKKDEPWCHQCRRASYQDHSTIWYNEDQNNSFKPFAYTRVVFKWLSKTQYHIKVIIIIIIVTPTNHNRCKKDHVYNVQQWFGFTSHWLTVVWKTALRLYWTVNQYTIQPSHHCLI